MTSELVGVDVVASSEARDFRLLPQRRLCADVGLRTGLGGSLPKRRRSIYMHSCIEAGLAKTNHKSLSRS